jgi:predicted nucleic acid-binding protein
MSLVLDSSATLAWAFTEERTPVIVNLVDQIKSQGAWVPPSWRLEVANTVQMGFRRKRYGIHQRNGILIDLGSWPIEQDNRTDEFAWSATLLLAESHLLSIYDAVYLELAIRRSLPLATLDRELRAAAEAEGVALLGL